MNQWIKAVLALIPVLPAQALASYPEEVLKDRPTTYLRFEETSGDTSASATPRGKASHRGVELAQASAAPALGRAIRLGGAWQASSVVLSDVKLPRGDFALEWWQFAPSARDTRPILSCIDKESAVFSVSVQTQPDPKDKKKTPISRFLAGPCASQAMAYPNRWFHVALVYKAGDETLQWFINGLPDAEPAKATVPDAARSATLVLGQAPGDAAGFSGMLDELAIYDQALPAPRIWAHYRAALASLPDRQKITTTAHRGNNRYAPENTRISYLQAIDAGAPIMELDLQLSKDGQIVLMHDPTLKRTTGAPGKVSDHTADQLARMDAGAWKDPKFKGEPVPRLEQITEVCRGRAIMMLDLKTTGLGRHIAAWLAASKFPKDQVILGPWTPEEGQALRQHLPDVFMIQITGKIPATFDQAYFQRMKAIGFNGFSIDWRNLPQGFVDAAHHHGMKVYTWTLNAPVEISGAVLAGVDGIITDDPAATRQLIAALTAK